MAWITQNRLLIPSEVVEKKKDFLVEKKIYSKNMSCNFHKFIKYATYNCNW